MQEELQWASELPGEMTMCTLERHGPRDFSQYPLLLMCFLVFVIAILHIHLAWCE